MEATGYSSIHERSATRGPRILLGLVGTHFLPRFDLFHFQVLFTSQLKGGLLQPDYLLILSKVEL